MSCYHAKLLDEFSHGRRSFLVKLLQKNRKLNLAACKNSIFTLMWLRRIQVVLKPSFFFSRLVFCFTCLGSPSSYWEIDIPSTDMQVY